MDDWNIEYPEMNEKLFGREDEFDKRYRCNPLEISDRQRLEEIYKELIELYDQLKKYQFNEKLLSTENNALKITNEKLIKMNKELIEDNKILTIKVEKIYSRFEILDL